jgi:hypothetical protein
MTAVGTGRNFGHLQEAADAVDLKIAAKLNGTEKTIKASAGLILTRKTDNGEIEVLMGRLNKLNRWVAEDKEGVHDTYGLFSGKVQSDDSHPTSDIPAVFHAAAREVEEESLGALNQEQVLDLLSLPTTKLIKNAGWKFFTVASFHTNISTEEGEKIVADFNKNKPSKDVRDCEMTELAWVSLKQIVEAQTSKNEEYSKERENVKSELEVELGRAPKDDELNNHPALCLLFKRNIALTNDLRVAHYVARTIFGLKDNL